MSHLETWPDIFHEGQTYVATSWDGEDVVEKGERYLEDREERHRIVQNAVESFITQVGQIDERVERILDLVP